MEYEASIDLLDPAIRKGILKEVEGEENLRRKEESYARFEIYRERQEKYIKSMLIKESSEKSVEKMRKVTSINFCRKMVNDLASIYKNSPNRSFDGVTPDQSNIILEHYEKATYNVKLKKSNKYFKLHEQGCLQTIPMNGLVGARVFQPHHYDAIPNMENPEYGEVYIVSNFDRRRVQGSIDFVNQKIADEDDWRMKKIYYWWSKDFNFKTDYDGNIIIDNQLVSNPDIEMISNPIKKLNFIDISTEKDFEYWVRTGSSLAAFNVEFGASISDTCNINKMQGYSQAVFKSVEAPQNLNVGPHSVIWLKVDPKDTEATAPEFSFVSPSPDLNASIQLNENLLKMFLSSREMPISTGITQQTYSSGLERLLAMVERFEASKDDLDLYRSIETQLFDQFKAWNNYLDQINTGLLPSLKMGQISEDAMIEVEFSGPKMVQTDDEKLNFISKQLEMGLMTEIEAISELRGVSEEEAIRIYQKIKSEGDQVPSLIDSQGVIDERSMEEDQSREE